MRDAGCHAAPEKISKGMALGGADYKEIDTERGGKIDHGRGGVFAHGIDRGYANVALSPEFEHQRHDGIRFRIILPARAAEGRRASGIVDSNLLHVEHAQCCFAQLGFIERDALERLGKAISASEYGKYLIRVAEAAKLTNGRNF